MRTRIRSSRLQRLAISAVLAAATIATPVTVADAQPTSTSAAPTTTALPSSALSSTPTGTTEPTAAPPSKGTPPEQRRDRATPSPRFVTAGCEGFWNSRLGQTFTVCGRILDKYKELGGPGGVLGAPSSNELINPDGTGKRTSFEGNSTIYWHPDTDAHQIGGRIGEKWGEFGYESGSLGYPITDELTNPDGGKRQAFQKDSSIYYKNEQIGAHQIGGDIGKRWGELGWETGYLGYPITDELSTPNGASRLNHFENGSIYWSARTGAHDLTIEMMSIWGAFGWETGELGLPAANTDIGDPEVDTRTTQLQASSRLPQQLRFERGVGVVADTGEAFVQLGGGPGSYPVGGDEEL